MTGPTGTVMLLPEDPATPVIMVATGTGIAPFRSFIRRFFLEDVKNWEYKGLAWLFMAGPASWKNFLEPCSTLIHAVVDS